MNSEANCRPDFELMKGSHISPLRASYGCLSWFDRRTMTARYRECTVLTMTRTGHRLEYEPTKLTPVACEYFGEKLPGCLDFRLQSSLCRGPSCTMPQLHAALHGTLSPLEYGRYVIMSYITLLAHIISSPFPIKYVEQITKILLHEKWVKIPKATF